MNNDELIIIGDVHGEYQTLLALVNKLPLNSRLCFVGDLIDRGPESAQCLDFALKHDCIRGNHEQMMLDYVPPGPYGSTSLWLQNGGDTTLRSYEESGLDYKAHLEAIENLPYYLDYPQLTMNDRHLVVSHSSIAKYLHNPVKTSLDDILWNRDISHGTLKSANQIYNIFGHTVQKTPIITDYYACIDTGATYDVKGYGKLTAISFPSLKIYQQERIQ